MQLYSFPFYSSKAEQFRFDPRAKESADWNLFSEANRFLPFMIKKPADGQLIDCVKVLGLDDDLVYLIQPEDLNYRMYSGGGFDFIFYYSGIVEGMNLPCGKYYLQIGEYFSEVFTVADVSKMLVLEWQNKNNISDLIYQNGFFQRVYLDADVLEPKYKVDQEGEEDGFEVFHPTFTKVSKQLSFQSFLLPEFLVDSLAALPLHDQVNIGRFQLVKAIEMDVDWLVDGVLGSVEIKFNEAEFAVSKICAEPLELIEVDQAGYVPKAWNCNGEPDPSPYWQDTGVIECLQQEEADPSARPTDWRGVDSYCANGNRIYPTLEEFYTDDQSVTGNRKPNTSTDADYIAPVADAACSETLRDLWASAGAYVPEGSDTVVQVALHRNYFEDAIDVVVKVKVNGESQFTLPFGMPLLMAKGIGSQTYMIDCGKIVSSLDDVQVSVPYPEGYRIINQ